MEEVDKIIINALKDLDSNFEDCDSLKQWETDQIVCAVVTCLSAIKPNVPFPKTLPPNMSSRYRLCQDLALECRSLGYPGELGYQTFLYSGESDIRKLLMFLIEKIPKEESFVQEVTPADIFLRSLKNCLREELNEPWLPYEEKGQLNWEHVVPTVVTLHSSAVLPPVNPMPEKRKPKIAPKPKPRKFKEVEGNFDKIIQDIQRLKLEKDNAIRELERDEELLNEEKEKNSLKVKVTETFAAGDEGIAKLQKSIEEQSQKLLHLATQWEKHRVPLIEQYRNQMQLILTKENESAKSLESHRTLLEKRKEFESELKMKEEMFERLKAEQGKVAKGVKRLVYTQRILEIIGNIEKQKMEIDKILKDIRELQHEISVVSGQVARSFTVADETIFRDARKDDTSRKIYKLLASLHTDCSEIIQMVDETGSYQKEIKELEDQIQIQRNKDVSGKLERISSDLSQMQLESAQLETQIKRLQSRIS